MNDRDLMVPLVGTRDAPTYSGRCHYCGVPCYGRACTAHRDLTLIEQAQTRESHDPTPASTANGAGSSTRGV